MSLVVPLEVRVATSRADRYITPDVSGLRFRSVVPGGFSTCTMSLSRPLIADPAEIAYYARVYVYDRRSGATVWEGLLQDPGRSTGPDGQIWELSALGGSAHTQDMTIAVVYIDRRKGEWFRYDNVTKGADFSVTADPSAPTTDIDHALVFRFPDGQKLVTNSRVSARYDHLRQTGQKLARLNYSWKAGRTSASLEVQALTRLNGSTAPGDGEVVRQNTFNTAGGGTSGRRITTDYTTNRNTLDLRIIWTGAATTVSDDDTWASIPDIVILGTRFTSAGSEVVSGVYGNDYVLANEVVEDLVGRALPLFASAGISTNAFHIDQLAYEDGATPAKILDDMMALEPAYFWAAWESSPATSGKFAFEWKVWPTTVYYEAGILDGFDSPGSTEGLFNRILVRWKDTKGKTRSAVTTQSVPALSDAGVVRQGYIDLADEAGSSANATQAAAGFLADHRTTPNNGTLTVARPVKNIVEGGWTWPWEIRPGRLIRVTGVQPSRDTLNTSDRDAQTVFRIVAVEFDAASGAATLELDSYTYNTARAIAQAQKAPKRRR